MVCSPCKWICSPSAGDICVNTLKRDWNAEVTLKHILQVIRCLLIVPFPESSLNDEAGKLFMDSYDEFARRARIMTQVHATRGSEAEGDNSAKKLSAEDEETPTGSRIPAAGEEENESANGSAAKAPAQKRKAVDAKKKAMKRL
jgi:ubiquitin-conjugating enzyme E2 S